MFESVLSVISAIPAWFWTVFLFGPGSLLFLMFKARLETPKTRARITDWLREARGTARYERLVGGALGWVNARLTPGNMEDKPPPAKDAGWSRRGYLDEQLSPTRARAAATWAGSSPLIDLQALLIDIGDEPGRYWWLYLTFFSTLLPTFAHFSMSLFCLVALAPQRLKTSLIALIEDEEHGDRRALWAPLIISILAVVAVIVPMLLAVIAVATLVSVAPQAGGWYLFIFLRFAEALGAPVEADAIWI